MTELQWDAQGERQFETGVSKGVLYLPSPTGVYDTGVAWNGLTAVTEKPGGADSNKKYADNIQYLNLTAAETFDATVEAYTYPDEFAECDGTVELAPGISVGQQKRKPFGLSWQSIIGNDLDPEAGYKIHIVYGAQAAPSERAHNTVNDSPDALALSWDMSTTPIAVPGLKPASKLTIDSTTIAPAKLALIEELLYGTVGQDPQLPTPADLIAIMAGSVTEVSPVAPTYNDTTKVITIPVTTGVVYQINGVTKTGTVTITTDTLVTAKPASGYKFPAVTDNDWLFEF